MCVFLEDSAGEMSSDSLDPPEDAAEKDPKMRGQLAAGRSREESRGSSAPTHQEDCFVPADAEREIDCQTDEAEQLSEASTVTASHIPTHSFSASCGGKPRSRTVALLFGAASSPAKGALEAQHPASGLMNLSRKHTHITYT